MRVDNSVPFTEWWPVAETRLRRALSRFALRSQDVDDVVQTTAERALSDLNGFKDCEHLASWAIVVGQNLARDDGRRFGRLDPVAEFEAEHAVAPDVFDEVDAHIKRDAMVAAINGLTPEQRLTLAGDIDTSGDRRLSVSEAVRRHRLRVQLRELWDRLGVTIGSWRARMFTRFPRGHAQVATAATAVAVSGVVAVLGMSGLVRHGTPDARQDTSPVLPVASTTTTSTLLSVALPALVTSLPSVEVHSQMPTPFVVVDFGHTPSGDRVGLDVAPKSDAEKGVLYCYGLPNENPDAKCIYYPSIATRLFHMIDRIVDL